MNDSEKATFELIEQMMKNYLKRRVDEVFGANNNVCCQVINGRRALSGMGTIKFSDLDKFKDIIANIEFDGANMFFTWNHKTLATATMFTSGNFISDGLTKQKMDRIPFTNIRVPEGLISNLNTKLDYGR